MKARTLISGVLFIVVLLLGAFLFWRFALNRGFFGEFNIRPGKWISKDKPTASPAPLQKDVTSTEARESPKETKEHFVARCTPKVIKKGKLLELDGGVALKGEKSSGYSPLVSFEVLESGEVVNVRLERSSGFAKVDKYAMEWVRSRRYNARERCGVIQSHVSVAINWREKLPN